MAVVAPIPAPSVPSPDGSLDGLQQSVKALIQDHQNANPPAKPITGKSALEKQLAAALARVSA